MNLEESCKPNQFPDINLAFLHRRLLDERWIGAVDPLHGQGAGRWQGEKRGKGDAGR